MVSLVFYYEVVVVLFHCIVSTFSHYDGQINLHNCLIHITTIYTH